ncbi:MAG: hypothetical protein FGM55_03860 [Rhodoferax sp.]|nr:hypothetical protein [Rhodoferax sp.]
MGGGRFVWRGLLLWLTFAACGVRSEPAQEPSPEPLQFAPAAQASVWLTQAQLTSDAGSRSVALPNALQPDDFSRPGGRVRYRLGFVLTSVPQQPLGVLVRKLSLSGQVYLNGQWIGSCALGPLEQIRCLHKPNLFAPPLSVWRQGRNVLEFEIYANDRQANGLSSVMLGDALLLERQFYWPRYWVQVDLVEALTWLSLLVGFMSLGLAMLLRREPVYLWFGLASVVGAFGNVNQIASRAWVSFELFSWFIFSSRFMLMPLLLLTLLAPFGGPGRIGRLALQASVVLGPLLVWLGGNDRWVTVALYTPFLLLVPLIGVDIVRSAYRTRDPLQVGFSTLLVLLLGAGVFDWLRLAGLTPFEGLYLITYVYGGMSLLMGAVLVGRVASSLRQVRGSAALLESRVAERTLALEQANARLLVAEVERTKADERERLLQDMHDGFGSQLASARLLAEQGLITQAQLTQILQECMADLYLLVDTLGNSEQTLASAMLDFRFRTQSRLAGSALQVHWHLQLDACPAQPERVILHILRIAQEALNNAIKHARATHIWFQGRFDPERRQLWLSVFDDGVGIRPEARQGRGMNNMRTRAREIGAELSVRPRSPGTEISLVLTLKPH